MLAMTYHADPKLGLVVLTKTNCPNECENVISIPSLRRMELGNRPKAWYREAESVLLANGKVKYGAKLTESLAGVDTEYRPLVCAECVSE